MTNSVIKYTDPSEISTSTHIFISLAATAFAWLLIVKPFMTVVPLKGLGKYALIMLMAIIFCIVLPSIFIGSKIYLEHKDNIFMIVKLVSVAIGVLVVIGILVYHDRFKRTSWVYSTVILYLILAANIIEAVYTQLKNTVSDVSGTPGSLTPVPGIGIINAIIGIVLVLSLFVMVIKGTRISSVSTKDTLMLKCSLSMAFIITYTLWNLLFQIELNTTNSTLMFFCMTLALPIITHYTGTGDWLQVRGITLLFFILLTIGMGRGSLNVFPMYNTIDEDTNVIELNDISMVFRDYWFRLVILILVCLSSVYLIYTTISS
jgi:hypothetical protein